MMAVLMMMLLLLMLTTTTLIKPTDAKVDVKAARAQLRAEWFNSTKFRRHSMDPDERYYFEQIITGLDMDDIDVDEDDDIGPQAGRCVRREYRRLTDDQIRDLHAAFNTMKKNGEYRLFVQHHRATESPGAHFGPNFMCWHRVYLILLENAIRRHCPTCCIPYIDTRLDCKSLPRPSDSAIWTARYMGNNDGIVTTGLAARWSSQPSDCDVFQNGYLTRFVDKESCWSELLYTDDMVDRVLRAESYDDMCQPYDFSDYETDHGGPHMWLNGHMASLPCAPLDPFFFFHHCFVDLIADRLRHRVPANQWRYPVNFMVPWAHGATDRMRPFDYRNEDGLNDDVIGKNYIYEISPADMRCSVEADCSPTGLLWCDMARSRGECKAKCRQGGQCHRGVHAMCYCTRGTPRCDTGTCRCLSTYTTLTYDTTVATTTTADYA